ncbi:MAG: autotransporter domain-containing protein, partial [Schwartzia sp.]|nr:autotransporter domain-containing protein [Schwartzia sp. (in: firmicutes)]
LRDAAGVGYGYNTSAGYWGVHLGLGKEIEVAGDSVVDVYAKYFHNRRNGVSFDAGGNHYDLDAVTSSVLRVGARYTMKRDTLNYYGGLAYEHELDGKAAGNVDGLAIRAAETKGGSARLELGATLAPENSPWSLDLSLTGFAGKKRGLMGGVSVAWMF